MLLVYLIVLELGQFIDNSDTLLDYLLNFWNLCDIFQLLSTLYIVVSNLVQTDNSNKENERIMAAFTVFFAWVKVFDWLRLFDETAFYMKLLKQTLEDMWSFVLIYAVGLAMVGSSMYVM